MGALLGAIGGGASAATSAIGSAASQALPAIEGALGKVGSAIESGQIPIGAPGLKKNAQGGLASASAPDIYNAMMGITPTQSGASMNRIQDVLGRSSNR